MFFAEVLNLFCTGSSTPSPSENMYYFEIRLDFGSGDYVQELNNMNIL
jgi:hypothetical protein